jgi:putative ABC transport system substrate-binding protein
MTLKQPTGALGLSMRRREFIAALGGGIAAWPLAASGQQQKMPVVGYLSAVARGPFEHFLAGFLEGLKEFGYTEGQSVSIEYRWAEGHYDRLPALAADLVSRNVSVIAATGGNFSGLAAKNATTSIPIVFSSGVDPVEAGLVPSFSHPGGNVTGVALIISGLDPKKLGLLRELVPASATVGVLLNPESTDVQTRLARVQNAARTIGLKTQTFFAKTESELIEAFENLAKSDVKGLVVSADPFFNFRRDQIVALAFRFAMPAIFEGKEYAQAGGLMSYGTSFIEGYRQVGRYVGRILKGEKPSDLPVVQSSKFELVINMKTAKALGINIPNSMQILADEIIE